jgi:starch phosphorylase
LEASKGGNAFTVHTPVKAGNDEFPPDLILRYFNSYITDLGIDKNKFLSLGRFDDDDEKAPFKMPVLAIRLSSFRNGVSKLHGKVSRRMWSGLWPQVPISEVPITSITNGVHIKTWLSPEMDALYDRYLGVNWTNETIDDSIWKNITEIPDEELWRTHQRCKAHLISFARRRLKSQMQRRGTYHTELNWAEEVLDPEALTIGFARRFATYKRGNLLFRDAQRIMKILSNTDRPLQIIFAGKAHPRDTEGKEIIRQIIHFANQHNVRRRIVFLEDYDINVARYLVQGVDIWLNNPRPPLEASGTSGMKAAFNGALNVSTWDGWWCEGYAPQAGWVIGSGETYEDAAYQDMVESESMYNLLENEIIPLFYTRATDGIPRGWIHRMKHAIKRVTPMFNTHRMVSEYNERFYMPAADRWNDLTTDSLAKARELSAWQKNIHKAWKSISIKDVLVGTQCNGDGFVELKKTQTSLRVGAKLAIRTLVSIGDTNPDDVSIELYHGRVDSWGSIVEGESLKLKLSGDGQTKGEYWFEGLMPCTTSGRQGMVVRVLPANENLVNPHEPGLILWESGQFSSN